MNKNFFVIAMLMPQFLSASDAVRNSKPAVFVGFVIGERHTIAPISQAPKWQNTQSLSTPDQPKSGDKSRIRTQSDVTAKRSPFTSDTNPAALTTVEQLRQDLQRVWLQTQQKKRQPSVASSAPSSIKKDVRMATPKTPGLNTIDNDSDDESNKSDDDLMFSMDDEENE